MAAVVLGMLPGDALGQSLGHPLVPGGRVRFDFVPSVTTWDTRYGLRMDGGSVVEEEEALGSDFTDPRGVSLFPGIASLEEAIRALSGDAGFEANLGSTTGRLSKEVTRLDMGLRLGVFDWLTIGGNVPYVRGQTSFDLAFRPSADANLGINPALGSTPSLSDFLSELGDAAVAAQNRAQSLCGAGAGADCQSATALSTQANSFWQGLLGAYFVSPFFPLESSAAATKIQEALASLHGALTEAGLPGVNTPMAFASTPLDAAGFAGLPGDAALGISGSPLEGEKGLWQLGDVELNATVRLLELEVRDSAAVAPKVALGLYGGFLVRLATGLLDDPDVFLDIGSGDGQMDMEGRVDGALRVGSRLALHGGFRYGRQSAVDIVRRVTPHEVPLAFLSSSRVVTWTPGDYSLLEISPRLHVTEALALSADFRRFHKAADAYAIRADGSEDGVDISVLGRETEITLQELALGLRYSSLSLWRQGRTGTPAEVGVRLIRPLSGSGGQAPKATRLELSISLFRRIWGA